MASSETAKSESRGTNVTFELTPRLARAAQIPFLGAGSGNQELRQRLLLENGGRCTEKILQALRGLQRAGGADHRRMLRIEHGGLRDSIRHSDTAMNDVHRIGLERRRESSSSRTDSLTETTADGNVRSHGSDSPGFK